MSIWNEFKRPRVSIIQAALLHCREACKFVNFNGNHHVCTTFYDGKDNVKLMVYWGTGQSVKGPAVLTCINRNRQGACVPATTHDTATAVPIRSWLNSMFDLEPQRPWRITTIITLKCHYSVIYSHFRLELGRVRNSYKALLPSSLFSSSLNMICMYWVSRTIAPWKSARGIPITGGTSLVLSQTPAHTAMYSDH